jgi:hypothetical protein
MSCSAFTKEEIEAQIAALKTQLTEVSAAISATLKSQQYSLDTGQTRQSVMRAQLSQQQNTRKAILDEIAYWQSLLCEINGEAGGSGGSVIRIVPSW